MQVGIDVTCMHTNFGWCDLSVFRDTATSMVGKGNLAVFESSNISKTREVMPTKIGVHVCYINTYLHEFFKPIPID